MKMNEKTFGQTGGKYRVVDIWMPKNNDYTIIDGRRCRVVVDLDVDFNLTPLVYNSLFRELNKGITVSSVTLEDNNGNIYNYDLTPNYSFSIPNVVNSGIYRFKMKVDSFIFKLDQNGLNRIGNNFINDINNRPGLTASNMQFEIY